LRGKEQQKKRTSSRHTRNIYKEIEFSLWRNKQTRNNASENWIAPDLYF
jgi:hypothetical protein